MATVNGITRAVQHSVLETTWTVGNADVGTPDELARWPYHSVQISGTFGSATVVLQGSDDGVTYFTLKDVGGNAISATVNARFDFVDVPKYIRPSSTGGTGTSVVVIVTSRSFGH